MFSHNRSAFTLVEVMVALSLSALVLVGAREMLEALGNHAAGIARVARAADSRINAEMAAREAVRDLLVSRSSAESLTGNEDGATFRSSCDNPLGWKEDCEERFTINHATTGFRVSLLEPNDEPIVLRDSLPYAGLRYLVSANDGGRWTAEWEGTVMIPIAIGIILDRDTLLLPVGDRR